MEEIAILELKQKRLITMLSQIDPVIYLQKLQQELSALQVSKLKFIFAWNLWLIILHSYNFRKQTEDSSSRILPKDWNGTREEEVEPAVQGELRWL